MDTRSLRTSHGKLFELPSYPLALAVAAEWQQQSPEIMSSTMPLFSILNLCLDHDGTKKKEDIIDEMIKYLSTDTLLFRAFDSDDLRDIEEAKWGPATDKLKEILNIELGITSSFAPPKIPDESFDQVRLYLETFSMWELIAMERLVMTLKSTILAILLQTRSIEVNEAVDLSLVELDFQTSRWGEVEWHHGVERQDLYAKTVAATMIIHHATPDPE